MPYTSFYKIKLLDAAESMLRDFCKLLPELYGKESYTANAYLLFHLIKYVRLWGPLWTHSAFGFDNQNGHLKRFIHGRENVVPQLLFNVDVSYTLQIVHHELVKHESNETMTFLNTSSRLAPQSNMQEIGEHTHHRPLSSKIADQRTALCSWDQ